jgi:hypothetical protein
MAPAELALRRVIGKTRRRLRLQRFLDAATTCAIVGVLAATILVYLLKAGYIDPTQLWIGLVCTVAVPLLVGLFASLRKIPPLHIAKRIDISHALHDRVGTAMEFTDVEPGSEEYSDFMRAQIEETLTHLDRISARRAAPLAMPRDLKLVWLMVLCLVVVAILRFPTSTVPPTGKRPLAKLEIDPEELEPHKAFAEQLKKEALEQDQEQIRKLAEELNKLFEQIQKKELTRKELFAKLAELEKKYMEGLEGNFDDLLKKLKKMGGDLQKDKLTKEAGKALKKGDLNKAKKELEKLSEKLDKLKDKDKRSLARTLDKAARHKLQKDKLEKRKKQLERQIRRLKRQLKKQPKNALARRRLQRKKRQLQRLNRQQQRTARRRRQLQRLNRQMQRAAAGLRNKLSPEAQKALQKLARQMGKFANEINKMRMLGKAQGQLVDLKELLRRLGKGKGKKGRLKDFFVRAGGKKGKCKCKKGKCKCKGKGKLGLMLDPTGQGGKLLVPLPGQGQGQGQDDPNGPPGDGIGNSSDPNVMGQKTDIKSRRKNVMVRGKEGKGPNRSEVILGAADKGFSSQAYRRVYHDYSQIIEEVMKREDVPLGYKYYVKRYFQLIKPR